MWYKEIILPVELQHFTFPKINVQVLKIAHTITIIRHILLLITKCHNCCLSPFTTQTHIFNALLGQIGQHRFIFSHENCLLW